jgi:hypothetical protein
MDAHFFRFAVLRTLPRPPSPTHLSWLCSHVLPGLSHAPPQRAGHVQGGGSLQRRTLPRDTTEPGAYTSGYGRLMSTPDPLPLPQSGAPGVSGMVVALLPLPLPVQLVINAPWIFTAFWRIAGAFVDPVTKSKVRCLAPVSLHACCPGWLALPFPFFPSHTCRIQRPRPHTTLLSSCVSTPSESPLTSSSFMAKGYPFIRGCAVCSLQ